ncbi:hypothetical protein [Aquiflexum gelatinilyticum]|uniref:hypothetical protein n=1 Tax=Aquiflexum gelatinilyticum TaxID=2961943 RepID=UPI002166E16D|nr:hypothetical protein [Aquiflexum gelatinilyticum]MCS4435924.1 hypothetical protein [Aquiflexum gelatinilyticum]
MKRLIVIFVIILLASCTGQKKLMNKWVGSPKENLISEWGMPSKTVEVEPGGEILVFAQEVNFRHSSANVGSTSGGQMGSVTQNNIEVKKWQYTLFLVDPEGIIYHLTQKFYSISPEKINFQLSQKKEEKK